jgi:hypothetical protein
MANEANELEDKRLGPAGLEGRETEDLDCLKCFSDKSRHVERFILWAGNTWQMDLTIWKQACTRAEA